MDKRTLIIPGAAVAVMAVGYFGLSAYAASQAEKKLEDWLYDNNLDNALRWDSLSASPFGGSITLHGASLFGQGNFEGMNVDIDAIRLADVADEQDLKSISVELHGIRPATDARGPASALRELLQQSGRQELEPFDLSFSTRYDAEDKQASLNFSLDVPQLFAGEGQLQLNNARNLDRELEALGTSAIQLAMLGPMGMFGLNRLMNNLQAIELGDASFSVRDHGYFKRINALQQRYNYKLEPGKGSAEQQRQHLAEQQQEQWQQTCTQTWQRAYEDAEDACEVWWQAQHGEISGMRVSIEPQDRVRLGDLDEFSRSPERAQRTLKRLNLSIETL